MAACMGEHEGVINFTVGQRRGLGVATGEPLFVVKLDAPASVASSSARAKRWACHASC